MNPKPPSGLSREAKRLWTSIADDLDMDAGGVLILNLLCQSWDRRQDARRAMEKGGPVMTDRFGQQKISPFAVIERDSTLQILRCFHSLGMDLAPEAAR